MLVGFNCGEFELPVLLCTSCNRLWFGSPNVVSLLLGYNATQLK